MPPGGGAPGPEGGHPCDDMGPRGTPPCDMAGWLTLGGIGPERWGCECYIVRVRELHLE